MSSVYLSYMKAFGSDLRQIAVWEPGSKVELGDFGEVRKNRWERLGNFWDLVPKADQKLREYQSFALDRLSLGSAELKTGNAEAGYGGAAGNVSLSIMFSKEHSVFVRADKCETRSLKHVQAIAERLALHREWKKSWTFVNEVRQAKRFLVLLGATAGGKIQVTAKTTELLDAFAAGQITTDADIQISGSEVVQFLGQSGPIHMSLIKISGPGLLGGGTKAKRIDFAEGRAGAPEPVYVENVDAQSFVDGIAESQRVE